MLLASGSARAAYADGVASVRIELHGSATCPSGARFFDQMRARTARIRIAEPEESPDATMRVYIEARPSRLFEGELVLSRKNEAPSRRQLEGETCDAALSGLALVAALAMDPEASTAVAPVIAASAPPAAPLPAPPPPPEPPPPPIMTPPDAAPVPSSPSAPAPVRPSPEASPRPAPLRVRATAGLEGGGLGLSVPGLAVDGAPYGDVLFDRSAVVSPSFRLSIHRTLDASEPLGGGSASFAWTYGRAEACPVRLAFASAFALRPCALVDLGVLTAQGSGVVSNGSHAEPWATVGALARVSWTLPLRSGWGLVIEASGGATFPIVRESFDFRASSSKYEAPIVAGVASFGFGLRFR